MIHRLHSNGRMSQMVSFPASGTIIMLAGQVADDRAADVAGQTADVLSKIDRLLTEAGVDRSAIVSATIWLSDMSTFAEMNEVWDAWVAPGAEPVRACVESALASPALRVEVQVTAYRA